VSANSRQQELNFRYQSLFSSDVFLRMVKLVFDYAINVIADVLLSGHYVKSWKDCNTVETDSRTDE
ncbi:hypothetical protein BgiMline_008179, partial [Biomphalaria glabrata]